MTGAQLKSEIKRRGYTIKSVAQHMGTSAQNLGNKLVGDDVASGLPQKSWASAPQTSTAQATPSRPETTASRSRATTASTQGCSTSSSSATDSSTGPWHRPTRHSPRWTNSFRFSQQARRPPKPLKIAPKSRQTQPPKTHKVADSQILTGHSNPVKIQ